MENIFGKPNEGIHSYRDPIFNLAIVDVLATFFVSYVVAVYYEYNMFTIFGLLVLISIFIHKIFNVKTKLLEYLHI